MNDDMMAKHTPVIKGADTDSPQLDPEGLKALGLAPDASFGDVLATGLVKGLEEVSHMTPEQLQARFAEVAEKQGKTPDQLRAEIEALMGKSEEELAQMVMESPLGKLIEQDLARAEAEKGTAPATGEKGAM